MSNVYIVVRREVEGGISLVAVHPTYKGLTDFIRELFGEGASQRSVEHSSLPGRMTEGVEKVYQLWGGPNPAVAAHANKATDYYVLEVKGQ
jgi:hypothetical protein